MTCSFSMRRAPRDVYRASDVSLRRRVPDFSPLQIPGTMANEVLDTFRETYCLVSAEILSCIGDYRPVRQGAINDLL